MLTFRSLSNVEYLTFYPTPLFLYYFTAQSFISQPTGHFILSHAFFHGKQQLYKDKMEKITDEMGDRNL